MYTTGVILDIEDLSIKIKVLKVKLKSKIKPRPGQFVIMWAPDIGKVPLTISDYYNRSLDLIIVASERTTHWLHRNLRRGVTVTIEGPYGRGFHTPRNKKCLIVTSDDGIAPFPFLIRRLLNLNSRTDVILSFRRSKDVFVLSKLRHYAENVYTCIEEYRRSRATYNLPEELLKKGIYEMVYVGGRGDLILSLVHLCNYLKLPCEISLDGVVRCYITTCRYCTFKSLGVVFCKEGFIVGPELIAKMVRCNIIKPDWYY
ncbi:MAG: hypothetical protein DRJ49_03330 [Thermoprotei archaeon]|mgnify:CR=1 FL=1|nr:MAG: hypothetical protein DRN53_07795 [Thermoprotei archaeon]RLE89354.1 MAG: hypothetical protein DRJ49_03330 [Thermoprotei archaeon]